MGFLNNIRQKLAFRRLNQDHQKLARIRKSTSLEDARAIGILYYLPDEDTYKQVEEFIRFLTEMNLKVRVACYTDNKIPPHYFIPKLLQDILTPKDLSWIGIPEKLFVPDFLAEKFDILIDLSLSDHFPLLYLAALSKASLKIGRYDVSRQEFFDMMIHTSPDTSLQEFTEQILHYLKMFNNTNKA